MATSADPPVLSGWLNKKMSGIFSVWQKRWFRLQGSRLMYSHSPEEESTKVLMLPSFRIIENTSKSFSITLVNENGLPYMHLQCSSEEEKVQWWSSLQRGISNVYPAPSVACTQASFVPVAPMTPGEPITKNRKEDYLKLAIVGRGSCGKVLKVRHKQTGEVFAMKVMFKEHVLSQHMVGAVLAESEILRSLNHPFVVRLHAAFQTDQKLYLIEDFHCGGALTFHLNECGRFAEPRAVFYAAELCLALQYIHGKNIIYRDLKPGNIILDREGHLVITDFGLATMRDEAQTFCGTPHCMAPEVVQHMSYTKAVDWWSYGSVVFYMVQGCPPFTGESRAKAYERIVNAPLRFPCEVSKPCAELLQGCLCKDPTRRWAGESVQAAAFFKGVDWAAAEARRLVPPIIPNIRGDDLKYFPSSVKRVSSAMNDSTLANSSSGKEGGAAAGSSSASANGGAPTHFEGFSFYGKQAQ
eukprot:RCo021346